MINRLHTHTHTPVVRFHTDDRPLACAPVRLECRRGAFFLWGRKKFGSFYPFRWFHRVSCYVPGYVPINFRRHKKESDCWKDATQTGFSEL